MWDMPRPDTMEMVVVNSWPPVHPPGRPNKVSSEESERSTAGTRRAMKPVMRTVRMRLISTNTFFREKKPRRDLQETIASLPFQSKGSDSGGASLTESEGSGSRGRVLKISASHRPASLRGASLRSRSGAQGSGAYSSTECLGASSMHLHEGYVEEACLSINRYIDLVCATWRRVTSNQEKQGTEEWQNAPNETKQEPVPAQASWNYYRCRGC